MGGILLGIGIAAVLSVFVVRLEWRYGRYVSPRGALRHLRKSDDGKYDAEIRGMGWAWDPKPGATRSVSLGRVYGPGHATYRLTADGAVALHFARRNGRTIDSSGPVPAYLVPGSSESTRARRARRFMWSALAIYPAVGIIGAVVGNEVGNPDTGSTKAGHAVLGFFVGYLGVAVILHLVVIVLGASGLAGRSRQRPTKDNQA